MAVLVASVCLLKSSKNANFSIYIKNITNLSSRFATSTCESIINEGFKTSNFQNTNSKSIISDFYRTVDTYFGDKSLNPNLKLAIISDERRNLKWSATLEMKWPQNVKLEELGSTRNDAETRVFGKAVELLRELNLFMNIVDERPQLIDLISAEIGKRNCLQKCSDKREELDEILEMTEKMMLDGITGKDFCELNVINREIRNHQLHQHQKNPNSPETETTEYSNLNHKIQIFTTIAANPVTIINGRGNGKTTQTLEYILESFIKAEKGSDCNIIVTQPRLRAAAHELRGPLLSPQKGAVIFCTPGYLLNQLQLNPDLIGVSHVIIDESQEQGVVTDLLLATLRNLTQRNVSI
uniref:Helicase ATP-binding domain-containing protein n=1 Tax=Strigamia maritima TaxID=126957 RepID=T1J322_STRMM